MTMTVVEFDLFTEIREKPDKLIETDHIRDKFLEIIPVVYGSLNFRIFDQDLMTEPLYLYSSREFNITYLAIDSEVNQMGIEYYNELLNKLYSYNPHSFCGNNIKSILFSDMKLADIDNIYERHKLMSFEINVDLENKLYQILKYSSSKNYRVFKFYNMGEELLIKSTLSRDSFRPTITLELYNYSLIKRNTDKIIDLHDCLYTFYKEFTRNIKI